MGHNSMTTEGPPMDWQDRITMDPDILRGKPVIKGARISVELILGWFSNGWTFGLTLSPDNPTLLESHNLWSSP